MVSQYDSVARTWTPTGSPAPTSVQGVVTAPDGSTVTLQATNSDPARPGAWTLLFTAEQIGGYSVLWSTTPAGQTFTDPFTVSPAASTNLLTLQDCFNSLNLPVSQIGNQPNRDADMLAYAQAATAVVEGIIGAILPRTVTEYFDGGDHTLALKWKPTAIQSVTANGQIFPSWVASTRNGLIHAGQWSVFPDGERNIAVSYTAGTGKVPANVYLAVREEFRFLWQLGRQGAHVTMAQAMEVGGVPSGFAIPNRVYELLESLVVMPGFS